ncbi:hypothetical protein I7I53_09668 [Histoplasma capsulatum var. duboisii H88]|uniref:Uncharacterized protein n=1 Tax=Ajellomyces capsulatus (strain H88) TaxID=544711 RepID=A0A8A1LA63_AJEC8|nr:hypothetical protein I7I53_09668 [Histoplasma capsulatum var. duboisii H88]
MAREKNILRVQRRTNGLWLNSLWTRIISIGRMIFINKCIAGQFLWFDSAYCRGYVCQIGHWYMVVAISWINRNILRRSRRPRLIMMLLDRILVVGWREFVGAFSRLAN